jgi:transposase-like protein
MEPKFTTDEESFMGKKGQPMDREANAARRRLAKRLLDQGLAPRIVARQLGVSPTWIYKFRQQLIERPRWSGIERRSGRDRRQAQMPGGNATIGHRRSGLDRRQP